MFPEGAQTPPAHTHPLWFAALVAAVSAPLAYWIVLAAIELWIGGGSISDVIMRTLGMVAMIGVPVSIIAMFVFGYPLALLLRKLGTLSALSLCTGAVVIGAAFAAGIAKMFFPTNPVDVVTPLLGAATGLFAGIVFCLVAGIRFRRSPR
ncbi:MAG TPA: hypothetical protein VIV63_06420 [Steroidobacteraceae bacterium]